MPEDASPTSNSRWSQIVGERNFAQMTRTMQRLLDELDPKDARS